MGVSARFRLYYWDGSTFDGSTPQDWLDAPAWGVMAVATPDPYVGREIDTGGVRPHVHLGDYYVWDPSGEKPWWVDVGGLLDHLLRLGAMDEDQALQELSPSRLVEAGVKFGRSVDNSRWRELYPRIVADADELFGGLEGEREPPPQLRG